jgi:membrane associated rhomboid family serine protease
MRGLTDAIKHLIIINVILFAAPQFLPSLNLQPMLALWFPENANFGFWQFVSHMFMHGSLTHILFNMYALWAFGSPLEQMWGTKKFTFFYFTAGIGAGLIYTLVNYFQFNQVYDLLLNNGWMASDIQSLLTTGQAKVGVSSEVSQDDLNTLYGIFHTPAVGASGAIYGVLVAFGFAFPDAKLAMIFFPVPIAAKYFIPLIIIGDVVLGFSGANTGTAHFAHIGGALIGFLIMKYWQKSQFSRWD